LKPTNCQLRLRSAFHSSVTRGMGRAKDRQATDRTSMVVIIFLSQNLTKIMQNFSNLTTDISKVIAHTNARGNPEQLSLKECHIKISTISKLEIMSQSYMISQVLPLETIRCALQ